MTVRGRAPAASFLLLKRDGYVGKRAGLSSMFGLGRAWGLGASLEQ
jgi:hypothetical protein